MKKTAIVVLSIVILGLTAFFGVKRVAGAQATPTSQPTAAAVQTSGSIIAEASVVPVQDTSLAFAVSGMVSEVLVKDGDSVKAGQPLARLSGSQPLQAALSAAEMDVLSAQQDLTRLQQDAGVQRAQAEQALALAQTAYRKANDHREGMKYPRGTQYDVDNAWSAYQLALTNVALAQDKYDHAKMFPDNSIVKNSIITELTTAQKTRDQALATYNWLTGKPTAEDLNTADADLAVAKAKLEDAQAQVEKLKYGIDADQVALLQAGIKRANDQAEAARTALANLELKAPFSGTVTAIAISVGEYVQPGMIAARLADTSTWLVKTTDLTELNVAQVTPNLPVKVTFDALPDAHLTGHVQYVENYGENHQSDIVYTAVIKLDRPDPRLRWNMSALVTFAPVK
jgi:multidrug resistance efflux pump